MEKVFFFPGLISIATEQHACIICGFAERAPEGLYNSAAQLRKMAS